MNFNIYNSLMLVGAFQGIIFAAVIFLSKKYRTRSLFFLASLILVISLNNFQYYLLDTHLIDGQFFFGVIYIPVAAISMVLYFLYVKFFLFPASRIRIWDKLLFVPFILFFILTVFYKIILASGKMTDGISGFFEELIYIHEIFALLYSIVLLIFIFRRIVMFRKANSNTFRMKTSWLTYTSMISLFLCFLWGFSIYQELVMKTEFNTFYFLWIAQSFTIYWLGHRGIYQFGILEEQKNIRRFAKNKRISVSFPSKNEYVIAFEKYIVEEKNYLNSELTLDMVADEIGVSKSHLSRIINSDLKTSYTDYINVLRVEEAKLYMQNPEFEKYTLIAIGMEAGFNSKSSFNTAFKKFAEQTPSEFRKSLKEL